MMKSIYVMSREIRLIDFFFFFTVVKTSCFAQDHVIFTNNFDTLTLSSYRHVRAVPVILSDTALPCDRIFQHRTHCNSPKTSSRATKLPSPWTF